VNDLTEPEEVARGRADELDRVTHGQRRINLIWEVTQAIIAIAVTLTTLFVAADLTVNGNTESAAFLLLSNAFFLVIGFYFGRTNHQRVGGIGGDTGGFR
jgi:cobalamin synthase